MSFASLVIVCGHTYHLNFLQLQVLMYFIGILGDSVFEEKDVYLAPLSLYL